MVLLVFVLPLVVIAIGGVVAHARIERYWRACLVVGGWTEVGYVLYLIALAAAFSSVDRSAPETFGEILVIVLILGLIPGVCGFLIAMIVGLPLAVDRRIRRREGDVRDYSA